MQEEESLIVRPKDYANVAKFDLAKLQDPTELEAFQDRPLSYIAETMTGALSIGKTGAAVAAGRIVQGILKGRTFRQFGTEFKKLRDTGKIPDDFAEKKYGFQTWVELMTIIDEDSPNADRLEALKAMFFDVNKTNTSDGERIAAYHLWQITKSLSSGELIVLKTMYETPPQSAEPKGNQISIYRLLAARIGHGIDGLVAVHHKRLVDLALVHPNPNIVASDPPSGRLNLMGRKICENIENYQIALQGEDASRS